MTTSKLHAIGACLVIACAPGPVGPEGVPEHGDASEAGDPGGDDGDDASGPADDDGSPTTGGDEDLSGPGPDDDGGSESTGGGEPFAPGPSGCISAVESGTSVFDCDGLQTTVTIPGSCLEAPCGVILDIHGASMTAQQQDNNTNMRALGAQHGFVVVQPTTDTFTWSAGHQHRIMTGLLDTVAAVDADTDRVHVTGFSAGGGAAWVIVCEYADVFASAAPAAATGQYFGSAPVCFGSDPPTTELDLLYINGETDPFESMEHVGRLRDKIVADWAMGPGMQVDGDGTFTRTRYQNGNGTAFDLLLHTYETDEAVSIPPLINQELAGHCYPGSTDHSPTEPGQIAGYGCKGENSFHFGEVVVEFFLANPK